jgi:hypothetical protein
MILFAEILNQNSHADSGKGTREKQQPKKKQYAVSRQFEKLATHEKMDENRMADSKLEDQSATA